MNPKEATALVVSAALLEKEGNASGGARGREEVRRRFHVTRQHPADANDETDVGEENSVVYPVEMDGFHSVY